MPFYLYVCPEHGEIEIMHGPGQVVASRCPTCDKEMRRRYTMPNVNWNGQPPSKKAHLPKVMAAVAEAEQRRYDRGAPGTPTQI